MRNKSNNKLYRLFIIGIIIYFLCTSLFKIINNNVTPPTNNQTIEEEVISNIGREKYTKIIGNNEDDVTVMVYMIGTDLESRYGMATKDVYELLNGKSSDNINIVLQTGGCKQWNNSLFSNSSVERWIINSDKPQRLYKSFKASMTDPNTLSDFIRYSADNFPANRNILILWDHGGGSIVGYGMDENYPNSPSLSPDLLKKALANAGVKFDFIGFDACLMANLETALALEPFSDYLIASEETEPGQGWFYTNWINLLEKNTSTPTLSIGKQIIDDYILNSSSNEELALSLIDLGELKYSIAEPIKTFSNSTLDVLNSNDYNTIAKARSNTKEFSKQSRLDQVDFIDLVSNFNVNGSEELISAVKSSIKYNKTNNISHANGLSVYFPYSALTDINDMIKIYDVIDINNEFEDMVKLFASNTYSGQVINHNNNSYSSSLLDLLLNNDYYYTDSYEDDYYYDDYDWYEPDAYDILEYLFRNNKYIKPSSLKIVDGDLIKLSENEWSLVDNITLNMFIDDGTGYLDLGRDNVFELNDNGDLMVDSDGTWLSINDHVVSYRYISESKIDNTYVTKGIVPALLNGERVELVINFYDDGISTSEEVLGARLLYDNNISAKGLVEIKDGDKIDFICDYYGYDGSFIDTYKIGDTLIVDGPLTIENVYLDNNYVYAYAIEDIYKNTMWTQKKVVNK